MACSGCCPGGAMNIAGPPACGPVLPSAGACGQCTQPPPGTCNLPQSPYYSYPPCPSLKGPAGVCKGGPYGPMTPNCFGCPPCCTLNTPVPNPCCSPNQKAPTGPCPLEPPQMMVCYRRPNPTCPGKEEYQCFPAYFKLPEIPNSVCNQPQPFNPLPACCQ